MDPIPPSSKKGQPRILAINAGGIGDLHGLRARRLTEGLNADVTLFDLDKSNSRLENCRIIWRMVTSEPWDLVYQESTGIASGLPLILAARTRGQRFIISTGDPVGGYFRNVSGRIAGALFTRYEKALYRNCAGFIGWTPYLSGMALKMGARMAATIEGAVDTDAFDPAPPDRRVELKRSFGLDPQHIVCGVVGSIKWSPRQQYCYGLELVETIRLIRRTDVSVLIVGDGDGLDRLRSRVPDDLRSRVIFTGRLPSSAVADALNAMDVGFITQTLDGLGSYRLTTKLPEYLAVGLPIAMSPIPGYFDYVGGAGWALPAEHPGSAAFHQKCAAWLESLERSDIAQRAALARPIAKERFDYNVIAPRFAAFVEQLLDSQPHASND